MRLFRHLSPWYVLSLRLNRRCSVSFNRLLFACDLSTYLRTMPNIFFSNMHVNANALTQIEWIPIFWAASITSAKHIASWINFSWRFIMVVSFRSSDFACAVAALYTTWLVVRDPIVTAPIPECSRGGTVEPGYDGGGAYTLLIFHWLKNLQQNWPHFVKDNALYPRLPKPCRCAVCFQLLVFIKG